MITPDKIESALARIQSQKKESRLRKSVEIIAEVKANVSQNPYDIATDLKKLAAVYESAGEEKQDFYDEIYASLGNAIQEHMQILLDDATEIVEERAKQK